MILLCHRKELLLNADPGTDEPNHYAEPYNDVSDCVIFDGSLTCFFSFSFLCNRLNKLTMPLLYGT